LGASRWLETTLGKRGVRAATKTSLTISSVGRKTSPEGFLGGAFAFLGEYHRLGLALRVGYEAFLVQAVHCVPIEGLPRPHDPAVLEGVQVQEPQHRLIDVLGAQLFLGRARRREGRLLLNKVLLQQPTGGGCFVGAAGAALAHSRWAIEQFYEDAKGECG
jgi:hypothetical protein